MATLSIRSHRLLRLVALWILFSILGLHFVTVFQKMFTYSVNNKDYNHIKDSQTLKPLLEPKRTMHCPNPVIIQDPKKAIINEISKNKTTMDCRVNLNAGPIKIETQDMELTQVEKSTGSTILIGGRWWPRDCRPVSRVAVLVPYKDRKPQLAIFLHNIHPFLQRQKLSYQIFVVEQNSKHKFNKGATVNARFKEITSRANFDCLVIHDVDQLPEDDRIWYRCAEHPRHLAPVFSGKNYKPLWYSWLFGGALMFTRQQYEKVNGFSNAYFGWGGEDDDLSNRLCYHKFKILRYPNSIGRFKSLKHANAPEAQKRYQYLKEGLKLYDRDGLNSISDMYKLDSYEEYKLYTHILVSFNETLIKAHVNSLIKGIS